MAIKASEIDALVDADRDLQSESRLMRELVEGSEDALAGLYDKHAEAVFAVALRISRDSGIAEEVVQETFLTLWNRAELFDPSRGVLATWLLAIARNRAIDRLRAAARHERALTFSSFGRGEAEEQSTVEWLTSTGDLIGAAGPEPGPEMAMADKEARESIQDALASLAPVERRVIELAYDTGMSQSAIAVDLGWPVGTVKTRTRRALRHLRERLEEAPAADSTHDRIAASPSEPDAWHPAIGSPSRPPITSTCTSPC
jgi:RNA polymerase sigma-70 factor, ECF subfamily